MRRLPIVLCILALAIASLPAGAADTKERLAALREITAPTVKYWRLKLGGEPGGEKPDLDDSAWEVVSPEHAWNVEGGRAWYRKTITVPGKIGGFPVEGQPLILRIGVDDDGDIFISGVKKLDFHWGTEMVLAEKARPGDKIQLAVLAKNGPGPGRLLHAQLTTPVLKKVLDAAAGYQQEIEVAGRYADADKADEKACRAAIARSLARVDFAALDSRDANRFLASLERARGELGPVAKAARKYEVDLIGHAHIDLAWLWRWRETVDVCKNTFHSVLNLMDKYPDFTFSQSQAQTYEWIERYDPELFKKIQQRVKEGRWEITGAMWVEPDCNIPSGESFVRQLLYGKRYFQKNFGVDVKVGWNPDTFGFAASLPQIYKKAGVDNFLSWRVLTDSGIFHYPRVFWWESPDGSKVLTFLPDTYNGDVGPALANRPMEFKEGTGLDRIGHVYGVGDHGGGPTRAMVETAIKMNGDPHFPRMRFSTAQGYFDYLRNARLDYPTWKNELFNNLNGCQTPQAEVKKGNRKSEVVLGEAETFGTLATFYGAGYEPMAYESLWRKLLMNQFHDILSGTGIGAIYKDTLWDMDQAQAGGRKLMKASLDALAAQANTAGEGLPIVVYNPLSWERTDVAAVDLPESAKSYVVKDSEGNLIPWQEITNEETGKRQVIFIAEKVPAVGYKTYRLVEGVHDIDMLVPTLDDGENGLQNKFFRVKVDPKTGCITSMVDKATNREAFDGPANMLQTFEDHDSAWTVNAGYPDKVKDMAEADSVKLIENGPVRAVIRVAKHFGNSRFTQDLTIYDKIPRLDCRMYADWNEKHVMLKARFPMAEKSDHATFEIPYGAIERSTGRTTPEEKYKIEVGGQKWADMSGKDFGVSILNDCKYSWDVIGNQLRLTLLRSTTEPDRHADEGEHRFTYSIYPHQGGWQDAGTVRRGYELNYPLIARIETPHAGGLPAAHSFLSVGPENVALGALKRAEDDRRWIIRIYETNGQKGEATITLPRAPRSASETDLLEKPTTPLKADGRTLRIPIGAWEIKTIAVEL